MKSSPFFLRPQENLNYLSSRLSSPLYHLRCSPLMQSPSENNGRKVAIVSKLSPTDETFTSTSEDFTCHRPIGIFLNRNYRVRVWGAFETSCHLSLTSWFNMFTSISVSCLMRAARPPENEEISVRNVFFRVSRVLNFSSCLFRVKL